MNVSKYIGLEFAHHGRGPKYDCWGLAIQFLKDEFGYTLPDFSDRYIHANDQRNIPEIVLEEKPRWEKRKTPEAGNLVLFTIAGHPMHVGVVISDGKMLHITKGINACIEKYTVPKWKQRIEGFYAYPEPQAPPV